jgi:hypothetical protein
VSRIYLYGGLQLHDALHMSLQGIDAGLSCAQQSGEIAKHLKGLDGEFVQHLETCDNRANVVILLRSPPCGEVVHVGQVCPVRDGVAVSALVVTRSFITSPERGSTTLTFNNTQGERHDEDQYRRDGTV